jgi:hypothetical protein
MRSSGKQKIATFELHEPFYNAYLFVVNLYLIKFITVFTLAHIHTICYNEKKTLFY